MSQCIERDLKSSGDYLRGIKRRCMRRLVFKSDGAVSLRAIKVSRRSDADTGAIKSVYV